MRNIHKSYILRHYKINRNINFDTTHTHTPHIQLILPMQNNSTSLSSLITHSTGFSNFNCVSQSSREEEGAIQFTYDRATTQI